MNGYMNQPTIGGHAPDEVVSTLQKAIRRGDEDGALWAATEMDLSGRGAHAWSRLRTIASEDVGLAEPGLPAVIRALFDNWSQVKPKTGGSERLYLIHAVLLLARARKSRLVDNATVAFYLGERPHREIPDHALDKHTRKGRVMGRGFDHFFDVGAQLANAGDVEDPYADRARATLATTADRQADLPLGATEVTVS